MIVTEEFLRKHNLNIDSTVTVAPANVTIRRNEMKNKTGGPAFPHVIECVGDNLYRPITEGGMTLRDYFAAKAMQSFVTDIGWQSDQEWFNSIAESAYRMADGMIKARINRNMSNHAHLKAQYRLDEMVHPIGRAWDWWEASFDNNHFTPLRFGPPSWTPEYFYRRIEGSPKVYKQPDGTIVLLENNDPDQSSQYSGIISDPRNTYDTKQSKPEWVGLEKEEIEDIWKLLNELNWSVTLRSVDIISQYVEIKLKEKNT